MKRKPHLTKYHRIILKLSGEFFGSDGKTFNEPAINYVVEQILQAKRMDVRIGIVVGGGNIIRGRDAAWLDKIDADLCGMIGTAVNGIVLHSLLEKKGQRVKLSSGIAMEGIAERFNKFADLEFYNSGGILIFVGGTGNPLFTTDTAAALRAVELRADALVKGTKVAGVYSADPVTNKNATFYKEISYAEVIKKRLKVMDLSAFNTCRDAGIPICVYNFFEHDLRDVLAGRKIGTIISGG